MTAYDKSVETARQVYVKEAKEREYREYLDREKETHKVAARIWFNLLTEFWPPKWTEGYWTRVSDRLNQVWNEAPDNELLHRLLLMTHEYLGAVAERGKEE